jgi:hypothetical protein
MLISSIVSRTSSECELAPALVAGLCSTVLPADEHVPPFSAEPKHGAASKVWERFMRMGRGRGDQWPGARTV